MAIHEYKTAIVTGAASGIGAASARMLVKAGVRVFAVDRDTDALTRLAEETGCDILGLDLRDNAEIYRRFRDIDCDILINNAGLAHDLAAGFLGASAEQVDEMIAVNLAAAVHVIRAVLPGMQTRRSGHIFEIGSIAGLYPLGLPVYSATKGAIHSLSQALRIELSGTGIRHTEICPGRTSTGFFETAFPDEDLRSKFVKRLPLLDPDDIAAAIHFALVSPIHMNVGLIELTPTDQAPGGRPPRED